MAHLPTQQRQTDTYLEIRGIKRSLERLRKDDAEGVVTGIWIAILASVFKAEHEYMIRAQGLSPGGLQTFLVSILSNKENNVMRKETQDSAWEGAKAQLLDYLPHLEPKRKRPRYGIVAVGKWAQFVLFDEDSRQLTALHDGHLHVERQCQDIQDLLVYVRENH
ncbi:uncharacterized protein TERG_08632 [Trichophyton rubrum CBS 118892]|uniref:Uncharacterized protein n=1 Tax=Trichophyton rubrum (strain ATCC MYA-4607 / CBS 118892) TaxID=559305 RepID=F2T1E3_TRIRC|nr:uncharacterized protein TERG_08632 [Trichophyton rubrum CBS 118892]EGD92415.2 hypothetical protein TERG_08632 [Trichophyton rubrum CBS 118892]